MTLRRSPLAARGVTDLAGAPLHAGPLTPSAAIEHHVLRRVVILDAGYRRWCDALVGGKIWLWIPGTVNREDVDAVEDGEEPPYTHASPTRHRRRRGGSNAAVSPAEAEKAGRWAVSDVERYDPTTGRHALVVEGGVGFKPAAGAPPALQHVALVERKYRVIHRPEPKPPPPPEKPRLGKDKKKRSKPDAKTDSRTDKDESARKRRRKAKEPVKATKPEDVTPDTFRVILLQPEADWDVDVFVENHVDQIWNILEEEAAKFAPRRDTTRRRGDTHRHTRWGRRRRTRTRRDPGGCRGSRDHRRGRVAAGPGAGPEPDADSHPTSPGQRRRRSRRRGG